MPELPEVETIARKLRRSITGKRIAEIRLSGKSLRRPIPAHLITILRGRTIRAVHRRGKYLVLEMEPRAFWLIHLGMSGRVIFCAHGAECVKHTHAAIQFADGGELQFRDPRRFGLMDVYQVDRIDEVPEMRRLGHDPLSAELDARWLGSELARTRRDLKSFLLDQRKIAGLGNIYVCEALFRAGLHPERRCHTVKPGEAAALVRAVRAVIRTAVENRGTSFSDFIDSDGEPGAHQDFLRVFFREGEKCRRCRALIVRIRQGNRSTYLCPRCQQGPKERKNGGSRDRRL
jgi:formamidopyrimidine-DNA glycosylase